MAESNRNATNGEPVRQEGEPVESLETARQEGDPAKLPKTTRHKHALCLDNTLQVYKCSGCKEIGNWVGYKCKNTDSAGNYTGKCGDFSLHKDCAELDEYSFPSDRRLTFRAKTRRRHHCNACHKLLKGYVFESENRDLRIHPMCMTLPETLQVTAHPDHQLKLLARDERIPYTCFLCHKVFKSGGWRYRCQEACCRINVDVSCAKKDIYGLLHRDLDIVESTTSGGASLLSPGNTNFTCFREVILGGFLQSLGSILFDSISNCCCRNDEANGND